MRKILLFCTLLFAITVSSQAQFVLSTVPPLNGGNGSGGCTFNLTANRSIILDSLRCSMNAGSFNMDIWYNPNPINGSPTIDAANGWVLLGSASVVSSGGNVPQNIPVGLGLVIPSGSTYGFYCGSANASVIYTTHIAGNQTVFADNNISIESGPLTGYGGSVPVPVNHPRQFNGAAVYRLAATGPNDASVLSLDQPVNFCGGTQNVAATIANYGTNIINSVDVNWAVNGVLQTPISYSFPLDTFGGIGNSTAQIALGTYNFIAGQPYIVQVWTSNPNGVADSQTSNDSIFKLVRSSLSGNFTIGSNGDYPDLISATADLQNFGICGNVNFTVDAGTYVGNHKLTNISGTQSGLYSISFASASGLPDVIVTSPGTGSAFEVSGTNAVSFQGFHFLRTNGTPTTVESALNFNNSSFSSVTGCIIEAPTGSSFNNRALSIDGNSSFLTVSACEVIGGYYGVYLNGSASQNQFNNTITFCDIHDSYYYGFFAGFNGSLVFDSNTITDINGSVFNYGSYLNRCSTFVFSNNRILGTIGQYGLYCYNYNGDPNLPNVIFNNEFSYTTSSNSPSAIYLSSFASATDSLDYCEVYNNSANITYSATSSVTCGVFQAQGSNTVPYNAGLNVVNNIFAAFPATGSAPNANMVGVYFSSPLILAVSILDNNNYYIDGSTNVAYEASSANFYTLFDWQVNSFQDQNSTNVNPNFIASSIAIPNNSLINNTAQPISYITTDILGNNRSSTPDIGAYEFNPAAIDLSLNAILSPGSGCALSATESLDIVIANNGFNTYNASLDVLNVDVNLNGVSNLLTNNTLVLAPGQTDTLNFGTLDLSALGNYGLTVTLSTAPDSLAINNVRSKSLVNIPVINTLPYFEDFESGTNGWTTGGSASSWAFGTPAGTVINSAASGDSAWVTNLNGNYNNDEISWIQSPCFDLSTIPLGNGRVKLRVWYETETTWDGANLQYSLDGGATWTVLGNTTSGLSNWYTQPSVNSSNGQPVWAGSGTASSQGWLTAEHDLDAVAGESSVLFRIGFTSDASVTYEGIGIDDFEIYERRNPIIDSVTIVEGDCAPYTKAVKAFVTAKYSPITAALLYYKLNSTGGFSPAIMTYNTSDSSYNGTIPLSTAGVEACYYVTVVDGNSLGDTTETLCYTDAYLSVNAGPDQTIVAGDTATLSAVSSASSMLITEVLANRGGTGTQATWPAHLAAAGTGFIDMFELTNISAASSDISGYTLEMWDASGNPYSKTFPANTVVPGGGVVIVQFGSAPDDPINFVYSLNTTGTDVISSGTALGVVLKNANGTVLDAMTKNTFTFPAASGVGPNDYTGSNASSSGFAGVYRTGADTNDAADWIITSAAQPSSLGTLNPGLIFSPGNFIWTSGGVTVGTTSSIKVNPLVNTTYIVELTDGKCSVYDTVNVIVTAAQADGGVSAFVSPTSGGLVSNAVNVTVTIKNYGRLPISNFDVVYVPNGGSPVTQTYLGTILSNATANIIFTQQWTPPGGNYQLCAYTVGIPNDIDLGNDTTCITVRSNVGIEEIAIYDAIVNVYPVPASDVLYFELGTVKSNADLNIFDAQGKLVLSNKVQAGEGSNFKLDISKLSAGVYSWKYVSNEEVQNGNFVITR